MHTLLLLTCAILVQTDLNARVHSCIASLLSYETDVFFSLLHSLLMIYFFFTLNCKAKSLSHDMATLCALTVAMMLCFVVTCAETPTVELVRELEGRGEDVSRL